MFIFNGFLLLEMPQCTLVGQHVWMETRGTEGGGWETGKGGEQENNFPRAPTICSHFVIDFF